MNAISALPGAPFFAGIPAAFAALIVGLYGLILLGNGLLAGSGLPPRRVGWIWMGAALVWYALFVGVAALIAVTITHETPTLLPF